MTTIRIYRDGFEFPDLKRGDTYRSVVLPCLGGPYPNGGIVLGQLRDPAGVLYYEWGGSVVDTDQLVMEDIPPEDAWRIPAALNYVTELQVTEPNGRVTTEVNAGKLKVWGDNCFVDGTPALIQPGVGTSPGTSGQRLKDEEFVFAAAGPYETDLPPNGQFAELYLDGIKQKKSTFEVSNTGFTIVGIADGYLDVSFTYSY